MTIQVLVLVLDPLDPESVEANKEPRHVRQHKLEIVDMFMCLEEGRYQYVSIMVICYASAGIEYGRRTLELPV